MSENNVNENDNVEEEEETPEELEAAESVDLRDLGIEPLSTPIDQLLKIYNQNHAVVADYTKAQKSGKSDPSDVGNIVKEKLAKAIKSEEAKDTVEEVRSDFADVTESVFSRSFNLVSASVALQEIESLAGKLREEVNYHFDNAVQRMKDEKGIKSTPSESALVAKRICTKLRTLIENRVNIAQMMDPDSIPAGLLKTASEGKRGGFNTDLFPRSPRLDLGDYVPAGVTVTHLSFRFVDTTGDEPSSVVIPDGTTLRQVAHDTVSKGSYRVTGQEIERMLKKAGHGIGATTEEWSLKFDTGTLYGKRA